VSALSYLLLAKASPLTIEGCAFIW